MNCMVAGHTDNQRVSNPETIEAGHQDNWYLSAHRAITVAAELRERQRERAAAGGAWLCRSASDRQQHDCEPAGSRIAGWKC